MAASLDRQSLVNHPGSGTLDAADFRAGKRETARDRGC